MGPQLAITYAFALVLFVGIIMITDIIASYLLAGARHRNPTGIPGLARAMMALSVIVILGIALFHILAVGMNADPTTTSLITNNVLSMLAGIAAAITGFYFGSRATSPTPPTAPAITTQNLPNGTVNTFYSAVLVATGGTPPYRWSSGGQVPDGLNLDQATGLLSGTPTRVDRFIFSITVQDSSQASAVHQYTVTIA